MIFREEVGESLTLKFAESAARRREMGLPIISLGLGEPDFATPPEIISATKEVLDEGTSQYSSPLGIAPLREQLANKFKQENAIQCDANNILVAAGAKQAYQLIAMVLLEPDDEVVVVTPAFVSFIPQILLAEPRCIVKTLDINKENFTFPLDKLEDVVSVRTKLIVINSPNNPAGYVIDEQELKAIYAIAEKYDCYVISDEIYEKLNFSSVTHKSIGALESEPKRVITINGYSKSHAMTGWRVGYACFPQQLKSKLLKIQQHANTNTNTFIQKALVKAGDVNEDYLHEYCAALALRCKMVSSWAETTERISLRSPEAGFFAFLNISDLDMSSNEFCGAVIEQVGVALTPGIAFGASWDDHVRLSYAVQPVELSKGLDLISQFVNGLSQ